MTNTKYTIISLMGIVTLLLIFVYIFNISTTKAYADENIAEAQVTNQVTQPTTQRAPVSIAVYSNEITESSDTYDYKTKAVNTSGTVDAASVVVNASPAPANNTANTSVDTSTVNTVQDPQSTAAPDAPVEPDIITYPPTVAPPYTD